MLVSPSSCLHCFFCLFHPDICLLPPQLSSYFLSSPLLPPLENYPYSFISFIYSAVLSSPPLDLLRTLTFCHIGSAILRSLSTIHCFFCNWKRHARVWSHLNFENTVIWGVGHWSRQGGLILYAKGLKSCRHLTSKFLPAPSRRSPWFRHRYKCFSLGQLNSR